MHPLIYQLMDLIKAYRFTILRLNRFYVLYRAAMFEALSILQQEDLPNLPDSPAERAARLLSAVLREG